MVEESGESEITKETSEIITEDTSVLSDQNIISEVENETTSEIVILEAEEVSSEEKNAEESENIENNNEDQLIITLARPETPSIVKDGNSVIVTITPIEDVDGYILERNEDGGEYHAIAELSADELQLQ